MVRVITELMAMVFAGIIDIAFGLSIMHMATKTLLIFTQCISIIENLGLLGIKLPQILVEKIQDLNPDKNQHLNK